MSRQGLDAASGVVLSRSVAGEGDLLLALFLKGRGLVRVSARGAAGGFKCLSILHKIHCLIGREGLSKKFRDGAAFGQKGGFR